MNEKADNPLNLALELPQEQLMKSQGLRYGFNESTDTWELIIRYTGNLEGLRNIQGVIVRELSNGYAILNVPQDKIDEVALNEAVIFIEKPMAL